MEFDFLPKLPNSNLDDRSFNELVDECVLRIPRYCPEWTDHNLSDPGMTLIELFAWLTDQMLLRFNQVPRKNYVAFLELLGIRLRPPAPAQTNLTFYLATDLPEAYTIPQGAEVGTERTETQESVIFTSDRPLIVGKPSLRHFLIASTTEEIPQSLRDRTGQWSPQADGSWEGNEQTLFAEQPQAGNCFYLVIGADDPLDGNVLALRFKGARGAPTGIDPSRPPRRWQAWDGERWQSVLLREADDTTQGFSFGEQAQQEGTPEQGGDVILHLPETFPITGFTAFRGRWLRCVLTELEGDQPEYTNPPRVIGISVRAIGGTVRASQSIVVQQEQLGISDGKPGQSFQVQSAPILERRPEEYVVVTPPGELPQTWQEVQDFADSGPNDRHYTIDSLSGTIQFGPLIREPEALRLQTRLRSRIQEPLPQDDRTVVRDLERQFLEHQYGGVPPRGSVITLLSYRTGGGRKGNVQAGTLRFLKSAVPYVDSVTNHQAALNGADAESLDQAVLRAPLMLRSRDRAVTAEDFEVLTYRAGGGAIARVRCLSAAASRGAGTVGLIVVPQADVEAINQGVGIAPERLALTPALREQVLAYLDERRLIGVQVHLQEPTYTGVSVQAEVALEPAYNNPVAQQEVINSLRVALYRYLNPLTGGPEGNGWEFGRPVYPSDIVALLQKTPGVRYLGAVLLFALQRQTETWQRQPAPEPFIDPGTYGLICSWANERLRSSHVISLLNS